jgi:DNA-binding Xre family transcriptional regulator
MIHRLRDTATKLGYKNARELADRAHLPLGVVYPLWNGQSKRIDLQTLDKLCATLDVPINLILDYRHDSLGKEA